MQHIYPRHHLRSYDHVNIEEKGISLLETVPALLIDWHAVAQYEEGARSSDARRGGAATTTDDGGTADMILRPRLRPEAAEIARQWAEQQRNGEVKVPLFIIFIIIFYYRVP